MDKGTEQVDEGIDTLTWVDPPPRMVGRNKRAVNERRLAMDENPGRWLLYRADIGHASGTQYLKQLGYEATCRKNDKGTFDIYARSVAK